MNLFLALLLQADDLGKQPTTHAPGGEGDFSRIMIIVFIVTLAVAATGAIYMVLRGAGGAAKSRIEKKEKNDNQIPHP